MRKLGKGSVFVVGALAALTVAVTGAFGGPATQSAMNVAVTAGKPSEFKFTLLPKTAKKGVVTFRITNRGALAHDFKIAGKKTKSIAKGKTATLRITFAKAGKFAYLCTLPSHAAAGMKGTLVVK